MINIWERFHMQSAGVIMTLLPFVLLMSGCASSAKIWDLQFTPDSTGVVFLHSDESRCGLFGMGWVLGAAAGHAELCWISTHDGTEVFRILLHKGVAGPWTTRPPRHFGGGYALISPDSQHVAFRRSEGDILIVDRQGRQRTLPGACSISRIAWVSPTEVAYVETHEDQEDDDNTLTVWRQAISGDSERRMIYRAMRRRWQTYWSLKGQYAVMEVEDGVKLLDVHSGEAVDLGLPERADLREVAWSPDGTKVFLLVWHMNTDHLSPYGSRFVVFEPQTGRRVEWEWAETHRSYPFVGGYTKALVSCWTAESRYIVLRSAEDRWLLVDSQSRQTCDLSKLLSEHSQEEDIDVGKVHDIMGLPIPGWVCIKTSVAGVLAVDYEGRHFVKITEGDNWAISSDGKFIADSDEKGQVRIRELKLPSLSDGPPMSP